MASATLISLKDVEISTIKPYKKSEHPSNMTPSLFDLQAVDSYTPIVFFYKSEKRLPGDASSVVERIKESLSKILVPFFPFAGRWVKTYDARIRELECTDEGVPFIQAAIDEELDSVVQWKDFEAVELLGGYEFVGLDSKTTQQDVDTPLPSLFVQVTQFKCESFALHVTFAHMTTDGQGMFRFMKAWSEMTLHGHTSIVPIHDRSLVSSLAEFMRSSGIPSENDTEEKVNAKQTAKVNSSENTEIDPGFSLRLPQQEPSTTKTLHVRRQVIENLKQEAAETNMEVTTVDLITAHIWRSLNNLPESMDGKTSSVVGMGVEGRKRFHDPPLPESYFGNVIVLKHIPVILARDLATNSLLFAANIVHNTVRAINPKNWRSTMLAATQMRSDFNHLNNRHFVVTSWFRFPMYEVDFSQEFGNPILAAWNMIRGLKCLPYGVAAIQPPPPVLSDVAIATIQFAVQTKNGIAEVLFSNEQFLSFFL